MTAFARRGARVALAGRRDDLGEALARQITNEGGEAVFVDTDVTDEAQVERMVARTVEHYGRLDFAFNNAGTEGERLPVQKQSVENYRRVFDANVLGVMLSMKHEIPALLRAGGGAIVNNGAVAGLVGCPGMSTFAASKQAVLGLTKAAAREYAPLGIRVNAVCPAAVETPMWERVAADAELRDGLVAMLPIGRIARPDEVANAVLWLCQPQQASFVTGHAMAVDGGLTAP